ncbi:BnaC08g19410D [Brassica napus]|uniref:BnaC08g19410D protein n=1 Tax=Brassica napus TaxID=3708 RepID=A0A078H706_BRANA|nr:BnaC08g19410D [Brassica napus]
MDVYYAGNYSGWVQVLLLNVFLSMSYFGFLSGYAPEPFDVRRILCSNILSNGREVNVTIDGPVDPGWVALYEQNDKHSSALEFIQKKLGGQIMCLSQAVLNSDCAMYNRSAYLKMSNYFLTIYNSMDEDETLKKLI